MAKNKLYKGDNIESLKKLPDNCIDSVVTDPPYGLSFMNKKWDHNVPSVEFWKEVYRVLKPGGHILSFGGTRTYHRMVCNIEDAGFEIRDQLQWIYATGFPKSLNIKKQLDKYEIEICRCEQDPKHNLRSLSKTNIPKAFNIKKEQGETLQSKLQEQDISISINTTNNGGTKESRLEGWCNNIQKEGELQRDKIYKGNRLDITNVQEGWIYNGTSSNNGDDVKQTNEFSRSCSSQGPQSNKQSSKQSGNVANKQGPQISGSWEICNRCNKSIIQSGWGTGLKPANEPICLARKPISEKTVAENVLKWKTGGLNIDGCRIGSEKIPSPQQNTSGGIFRNKSNTSGYIKLNEGRFPANIIFDESAAEMLDEQTGYLKSGEVKPHHKKNKTANGYQGNCYGKFKNEDTTLKGYGDGGGASRFFYVAKVSKQERNMGLETFAIVDTRNGRFKDIRSDGSILKSVINKNIHPTVKPINLMSYLCKLITPVNGIVLDPFMGSGSTGIAALLNDFRFCGMEMDDEYFKIAEARIYNYEDYRKFIKEK